MAADNSIESIFRKIDEGIDKIQFLSPNEPISVHGVQRLLGQIGEMTNGLSNAVDSVLGGSGRSIMAWD